MALITCPECGSQVSSMAKTCPNCGYGIAAETNDIIRIRIDNDPQIPGYSVRIFNADTKQLITAVRSGSVAEIKSSKDLRIYFAGMTGMPMLTTTVSPKNGGRYHAVWGPGLFSSKTVSCSKVDVIDS
ncbi:MAG: zinc ribbon domain-containing protein [Clostridia bacterium]|nr:zinc ribbon domain-containing protein [Clostridia bacterium]